LPSIGPDFYPSVIATATLNLFAALLYFKALKLTDLSLSIPMISFTPLFLIFTSYIQLGESPTFYGLVGIVFIVSGSYVLNTAVDSPGLLDPFKKMMSEKGIYYILIVAFLFSLSSNFDKLVVINSDPLFGSSFVYFLLGSSFLFLALAKNIDLSSLKENLAKTLLIGLILSLMAVSINSALKLQIVPYVISLKRLNILFSVAYGALLFKEKEINRRSAGALIMVVGFFLITLF
jgi:drug/metabolite transporter (DMT)-like permease